MLLGKEDLSLRPVLGAPLLDPPLERPQLTLLVEPGTTSRQLLEQSPRLHPRRFREPLRDLLPALGKRVSPRPPPPRLLELRRQLARLHVPAGRIPVQARPQRGQAYPSMLAHLLHQFSHFCIADHSPRLPLFGKPQVLALLRALPPPPQSAQISH